VHNLIAITPLGGTSARVDKFDGLRIVENPTWALASLAARLGQEKQLVLAAKKALGFALPEMGRIEGNGVLTAFWVGSDQWMIEAPFQTHENLAWQVKALFGDMASVTEQTDGWARFDVVGPRAPDVFERLCPVNTWAMEGGAVSRTLIEHLGCFVVCRKKSVDFSVLGPRSAANSLHHALCSAAHSVI